MKKNIVIIGAGQGKFWGEVYKILTEHNKK